MTNLNNRTKEGRHKSAETIIALLALVGALGFNLWYLYPEVKTGALAINDSVFHLLLAGSAAEALSNGKDITDPWQKTMYSRMRMPPLICHWRRADASKVMAASKSPEHITSSRCAKPNKHSLSRLKGCATSGKID